MKVFLCLGFLMSLYLGSEAIYYTPCELYQIFQETGLAGYAGYSAANWICMAFYESSYNTDAFNNDGSSRDYGIFQINSKWWCNDGETAGAVDACHISCYSLLNSNISDDIECAKQIVDGPNGMYAWYGWSNNCVGTDLSQYTAGC